MLMSLYQHSAGYRNHHSLGFSTVTHSFPKLWKQNPKFSNVEASKDSSNNCWWWRTGFVWKILCATVNLGMVLGGGATSKGCAEQCPPLPLLEPDSLSCHSLNFTHLNPTPALKSMLFLTGFCGKLAPVLCCAVIQHGGPWLLTEGT